MSEDEAIKILQEILDFKKNTIDKIEDPIEREIEENCYIEEMPFKAIETILDLYRQEKEKAKYYEEELEATIEQYEKIITKEKEKNIDTIYANLEEVNEELMSNLLNGKPNKKPLSEKIKELEKENKKLQEELKQEKEKNKEIEEKQNRLAFKTNQYMNDVLSNNIVSKDKIRDMKRYREFELQQEYKDFESDVEWQTYNKILEED